MLARLRSIRRAQTLGFSLDEIAGLLGLDEAWDRVVAQTMARSQLAEVKTRIRQLREIRKALSTLMNSCEHTELPAPCPILHTLAESGERRAAKCRPLRACG